MLGLPNVAFLQMWWCEQLEVTQQADYVILSFGIFRCHPRSWTRRYNRRLKALAFHTTSRRSEAKKSGEFLPESARKRKAFRRDALDGTGSRLDIGCLYRKSMRVLHTNQTQMSGTS